MKGLSLIELRLTTYMYIDETLIAPCCTQMNINRESDIHLIM